MRLGATKEVQVIVWKEHVDLNLEAVYVKGNLKGYEEVD